MSNRTVLIVGLPNSGKTASLRNLPMKEVAYLNTDLSDLTFEGSEGINDIKVKKIEKLSAYIKKCGASDNINYVVLDTLTSMMGMYERQIVLKADVKKTMQAWGAYGAFYGDITQEIKALNKTTIVLSHLHHSYDEALMEVVAKIPIKGAVSKVGAERDFSIIVEARFVSTKDLVGHENEHLVITEDEEWAGRKRVFQTLPHKESGLLCRTPMGMFGRKTLYIDNDINLLLKIMDDYEGGK